MALPPRLPFNWLTASAVTSWYGLSPHALSEKLLSLPDPTLGLAACVHLPCGEMLLPLLLRAFPMRPFPPASSLRSEAAISAAGLPRLRAYGPRDAKGRVFNLMASCDATRGTAAAEAAIKRRWSLVTQLVQACPPLAFCRARGGNTLLHDAALDGQADVCRFLIRHCEVPVDDAAAPGGPTPLALAVASEHWATARVLLCEFNADPAVPLPRFAPPRVVLHVGEDHADAAHERMAADPLGGRNLLHHIMRVVRDVSKTESSHPAAAAYDDADAVIDDGSDSIASVDIIDGDGAAAVHAHDRKPFAAEIAAAAADGRWAFVHMRPGADSRVRASMRPLEPAARPATDGAAGGAGGAGVQGSATPHAANADPQEASLEEERADAVHFLRLILQRLNGQATCSSSTDAEESPLSIAAAGERHDPDAEAAGDCGGGGGGAAHDSGEEAIAGDAAAAARLVFHSAAAEAASPSFSAGPYRKPLAVSNSEDDALSSSDEEPPPSPPLLLQQMLSARDHTGPAAVFAWLQRRKQSGLVEPLAALPAHDGDADHDDDGDVDVSAAAEARESALHEPALAAAAAAGVEDHEPWLPAHACSALTPLGMASGMRCWGVVQTLLEAGAHPSSLRGLHHVPPSEMASAARAVAASIGTRAWRRRRALVLSRAVQLAAAGK